MIIYTSYFSRLKQLQQRGITCISVAKSMPQGILLPTLHEFVPSWDLIDSWKKGKITWTQYREIYWQQLAKLDRDEMISRIGSFSDCTALLCWEGLHKPCHRHIDAEWLDCGVKEFST